MTLTMTARKKLRRAERARASLLHERASALAAQRTTTPIPSQGCTPYNRPVRPKAVNVGDRVAILQRRGELFPNCKGKVVAVTRSHDMTIATVRLDRTNAAGQHIRVPKHIADLYVLRWEGEPANLEAVRKPRPLPVVEQRTPYNELYGRV